MNHFGINKIFLPVALIELHCVEKLKDVKDVSVLFVKPPLEKQKQLSEPIERT